jgi:HD-GYP domain-containing protein (c-di-GMP phosphodiesterase class II)
MKVNSVIMLREAVTLNKSYIDACLLENIPVVCINKETMKKKLMPFKTMYSNSNKFWLQNKTWEFFLAEDDFVKIQERVEKLNAHLELPSIAVETGPVMPKEAVPEEPVDTITEFLGNEYEAIAEMTETERVELINKGKTRLDDLIIQKPRQKQLITETLVETARDTLLCNHTTLLSALGLADEDAKKQTQDLVGSTRDLVKISSQLIAGNIFDSELMNTLVEKSNGTIIQHMTRVYLKCLTFLAYYNKLVLTSNAINRLRISFQKEYQSYYHSLLPHIHKEDVTLEKVFLGGMRAIPENSLYNWAVGFLIHDIGKAAAVEYHEGEAAYNRDIVMEHVKIGYSSIMDKTNYPKDVALITGCHHEYYGDPSGYGSYRSSLEQYRKFRPQQVKLNNCIAYDVEPILNYEAIAFFPAKVLEILDIYDSLTDPNRKYKKAMTTEEAITMMKEEFINKHPKIDLILFDFFKKFVTED